MSGGAAGALDGLAFEAWLNRVVLDDRPDPAKAAEPAVEALETFPAAFIRRAIIGHLDGHRTIRSGIEARRMRFAGDLHLENLEIGFPFFFLGCIFEGAIYGGGARTKTLGFTSSKMKLGADLRNVRVDGHVFLRGAFEAEGPILLRDAKIEGSLDLNGGRFLYDGVSAVGPFWRAAREDCLGLSRANAAAVLWNHAPPQDTAPHRAEVAGLSPQGLVNLRDMTVRSFRHDMMQSALAAWPGKGRLVLDGFSYEHISDAPRETLLAWLALQKAASPSPYFVMASVLQKQGLKDDAVRIRAQVRRNEVAGYGGVKRFFARIFFWPVDYGATPVRALWLMLAFLALYFGIVTLLAAGGRMAPSAGALLFNACYYGASTCKEGLARWQRIPDGPVDATTRYVPPDYPSLSPAQYSLEAFVPIVDFGQGDHWEPAPAWARLLLALVALVGLFLGSLFFAAVTGLLRPRES